MIPSPVLAGEWEKHLFDKWIIQYRNTKEYDFEVINFFEKDISKKTALAYDEIIQQNNYDREFSNSLKKLLELVGVFIDPAISVDKPYQSIPSELKKAGSNFSPIGSAKNINNTRIVSIQNHHWFYKDKNRGAEIEIVNPVYKLV